MTSTSSDPHASYLADPTIQGLTTLLREIGQGLYVFPHFQRPFVWKTEKRLELIRTVLKGLPIGTFMMWRTSTDVPAFERIGPWQMPKPAATGAGRQYVLDGLQRLLTLYVALTPNKKTAPPSPETVEDEARAPRDVYVDLSTSDLDVFENDEEPETRDRLQRSLPLLDFIDSKRLLSAQRDLAKQPDGDALMDRSDRVAETVRNYKVPVVPFVSDDLDRVTRAFQLVNSQGEQMSAVHMVNALSWSTSFRLLDAFDGLRDGPLAAVGWRSLDEMVLLRCFALAVDVPSYEFKPDELASRLRGRGAAVTKAVGTTLRTMAQILRRVCHIRTPALVPYSPQIVVLFGALHGRSDLSMEQRARVGNWLWYTSYVEAFGVSINESFVTRTIGGLNEALDGKPFIWPHRRKDLRPFPSEFDFRHGRARLFALRLAQARARADESLRAYRLLADEGVDSIANVLPPSVRGKWRNGRGARVVASGLEVEALRTTLREDFDANLGRRHIISEDAWRAYQAGHFQEFVEKRELELHHAEVDHFGVVRRGLGVA